MKKPAVAKMIFYMWLSCVGVMLAVVVPLAEPVLGESFQDTSADGIIPNNNSKHPSTEDSPLIGGGVRTPPDIGASGTSSSTPPVRTESPTDEPHIVPDVSPVPPDPSTPEKAPVKESEPLGQPDQLQKTPEKIKRF